MSLKTNEKDTIFPAAQEKLDTLQSPYLVARRRLLGTTGSRLLLLLLLPHRGRGRVRRCGRRQVREPFLLQLRHLTVPLLLERLQVGLGGGRRVPRRELRGVGGQTGGGFRFFAGSGAGDRTSALLRLWGRDRHENLE